jgi:hypothetical protein
VTAERGCGVNQLGSRQDAAANSMNQRAVAASTIEARQGRAGMVGGGDPLARDAGGSLAAPRSGFFLSR